MAKSSCICSPNHGNMTAFSQLKLLLWKNFTLKKRNVFILAFEIFLPLTLSLVILFVRKNEPIKTAPPEYNQAVPLPTAGWIPMLQFFCPETNQSDPYGFPIYSNSRVPEILTFLSKSPDGYPVSIQTIHALLSIMKQAGNGELKRSKHNKAFSDSVDVLMKDPIFSSIIMDAMTGKSGVSKATDQLDTVLRISKNIVSQLPDNDGCGTNQKDKSSQDNNMLSEKPKESKTDYLTVDQHYGFRVPKQSVVLLLRLWNSIQSVICGVNNTVNETILNDSNWTHKLGFGEKQMAKLKVMAFFLLRGHPQILYTPNSTHINQVIKKANESFQMLQDIAEYSEVLYSSLIQLKALLKKPSTLIAYRSYQTAYYSSLPDIHTVKELTTYLVQMTCFLKSALSKLNLDIFRPFPDEQSMARFSAEADRTDEIAVIAGLAFQTNERGELPPHVVYKLKMNDTYAPRAVHLENRLWYQNHYHDETYRFLLFPWIQDIVERAIIEDKIGRAVFEPGVHIREFPQPCRRFDDFTVSVFFSKAKLAAACSTILHLVVHIPYIFIMNAENSSYMTVSRPFKVLSVSTFYESSFYSENIKH
ncbi:ATP-binding cassette sub-family A member 2-like [Glandiceps talaboti]